MPHPTDRDHWVGELLAVLVPESLREPRRTDGPDPSETEKVTAPTQSPEPVS